MVKVAAGMISIDRAREQGWQVREAGTKVCMGMRFEPLSPLSWEAGGELFECGMNAVEVFLECENGRLVEMVLLGEFTPCSGRAIGGRAPAWIFPSLPMDPIREEELPVSVLSVIREAVALISEA